MTQALAVAVDDDPAVLESLRRTLRGEAFDLVTTPDPDEVLRAVGVRPVDLVLADQRMPTMSGGELARRIREISPRTAVVILTGFADTRLLLGRQGVPVREILLKPWDDRDLRRVLRGILQRRPGAPHRFDCRDGRVLDVLDEVLAGAPRGSRLDLALDHLPLCEGSIVGLILRIVRASLEGTVGIDLRESSGLARAVLHALPGPGLVRIVDDA